MTEGAGGDALPREGTGPGGASGVVGGSSASRGLVWEKMWKGGKERSVVGRAVVALEDLDEEESGEDAAGRAGCIGLAPGMVGSSAAELSRSASWDRGPKDTEVGMGLEIGGSTGVEMDSSSWSEGPGTGAMWELKGLDGEWDGGDAGEQVDCVGKVPEAVSSPAAKLAQEASWIRGPEDTMVDVGWGSAGAEMGWLAWSWGPEAGQGREGEGGGQWGRQ